MPEQPSLPANLTVLMQKVVHNLTDPAVRERLAADSQLTLSEIEALIAGAQKLYADLSALGV